MSEQGPTRITDIMVPALGTPSFMDHLAKRRVEERKVEEKKLTTGVPEVTKKSYNTLNRCIRDICSICSANGDYLTCRWGVEKSNKAKKICMYFTFDLYCTSVAAQMDCQGKIYKPIGKEY